MKKFSLLLVFTLLAGCTATSASYSRRDIVDAVQIISAQRGDTSNWASALPIQDKRYSTSEANATVRSALRDRWCKGSGAPAGGSAAGSGSTASTARDNANAVQLAAQTPDIRC